MFITKKEIMQRLCFLEDRVEVLDYESITLRNKIKKLEKAVAPAKKTTKKEKK